MNFKAAIVISAMLHIALLGYMHTVEEPEEIHAMESTFRDYAIVQLKTVRADEVSKDGSDDPAKGVPNPVPEKEAEPEPEQKPEPKPKPAPKPEKAPEPEPEPDPEPKPEADTEIKSVVTDKTQDSESPTETQSEVDATAQATASTAPVDSGKGNGLGDARPKDPKQPGYAHARKEAGPRGVRSGTGKDRKKLNQKYGLILFKHISKSKSYPRFARKANIEGRVMVSITIDRHGNILEVKMHKSSGHKILDESTIENIRKLKQFPPPPDALTWQTKTFVLPVNYKLS